MFDSIWHDIRGQFRNGNMLTRIILINIAVFVVVTLTRLILFPVDGGVTYEKFLHFFTISADWKHNLTHPWVLLTHTFLHEGFWHLLWNMILLYWVGRIVGDLLGDRRVLPIYLLGGLAGGLTFFLFANLPTPWDFGGYALGASAAFMAILVVAGMTAPDYLISLLFLGEVRLKFIVALLVLLDLVALSWNNNSGGSFGHLGGAAMGYFIAYRMQRGYDMTASVNALLHRISSFFQNNFTKKKRTPKMAYRNPDLKKQAAGQAARSANAGFKSRREPLDVPHQEQLDAILDKIKQTGYESLTSVEKEFLFNASKK